MGLNGFSWFCLFWKRKDFERNGVAAAAVAAAEATVAVSKMAVTFLD